MPARSRPVRVASAFVNPPAALFAVVGEALIDLVNPGDGTASQARPGGSPFNVAVGLARLGCCVAFVGRLSDDPYGTVLRNHATRSGVDLSLCVNVDEPSTIALLEVRDGEARYEFRVERTADFGWMTPPGLPQLPPSVGIVHYGSLASWLPPGDVVIARWIEALHAGGEVLISYDPNVRPALQPDAAAARTQIERALRHAHVVKASSEDLRWLYGTVPMESIARRWLAAGPALVVITRGIDGASAFAAGADALQRPIHPQPVFDTVGAGDAFTSGLLDALTRCGVKAASLLARLADPALLATILDEAALVAELACTRACADPPWLAEVEAARHRPH